MFQRHVFVYLSLSLMVPLNATAQDSGTASLRDQLDRPYAALFDMPDVKARAADLKSLRSAIERARDEQTSSCKREERTLRGELDAARSDLKKINRSSPSDDSATANARAHLHTQITALERVLWDKERECKHVMPSRFEVQLAKVRLLERWPNQRRRIVLDGDRGLARQRKRGDVDDIGYRKLADGQDKDVAAGEQAVRQLLGSRFGVEEQDAVVRRYVEELAGKIANNSDLKVPLHVAILDSPEIHSAGMPGGFLAVTLGLVLACDTESELAGVLAQEIAHIAARHGTRSAKRSIIPRLFVPAAQIATGIFTGGVSSAGSYYAMDYGFQGIGMLIDRTIMTSNAKAQTEADQLGIQYMWKAGFEPKGFISFFDTIAKSENHAQTERFLLSKPPLDERLLGAFSEIQFLPRHPNNIGDSQDFHNVKERLQGRRAKQAASNSGR